MKRSYVVLFIIALLLPVSAFAINPTITKKFGPGVHNIGIIDIGSGEDYVVEGPTDGGQAILNGGFRVGAGTLTISNVTLRKIEALYGQVMATAVTIDCQFNGDAGLLIQNGAQVYLNNSTITRCSPGVRQESPRFPSGGVLIMHDNTISNNAGGVVRTNDGPVSTYNTIVAGNLAPIGDCGSPLTGQGNLDSDGSCFSGTLNFTQADPHLGPLADNGGPTPTFALLPGSLAIDNGAVDECLATDQRGVPRPAIPARCDIGSFELVTSPLSITSFTPAQGLVGSTITMTGVGFSGVTAVAFNGAGETTGFTIASDTELSVVVPPGAGTGPIDVVTATGRARTSSSFRVLEPPTITAFSPAFGVAGTTVQLTGTRLGTVTSVSFNGTTATNLTFIDTAHISAQVPLGATTGRITVTNADGTGMSPAAFVVATDGASGPAPAGATITTLNGTEATPADPIETSVTHPTGGTVTIEENAASGAFGVFGQLVKITVTPPATVANPLIIVFNIDASVIPIGQNAASIEVTKDNQPVLPCTGAGAVPDACVASRATVGDDVVITIRSSTASDWEFHTGTVQRTDHTIYGAGEIVFNRRPAAFAFAVAQTSGKPAKGTLLYDDFRGTRIVSVSVSTLDVHQNTATFTGSNYTVEVVDNGAAGDVFTIRLSNGYVATGTLTKGLIQVK